MELFLITLGVMLLMFAFLAIGFIVSRKELKGSCGGLNRVMGEDCDLCDKEDQCTEEEKAVVMANILGDQG